MLADYHLSHRQFVFVRRTHRRRGQREIERRTAIYPAVRPSAAAVPADHPPHGGEPNARPLELFLAMQALKHAEQFSSVAHVEADAVVAHVEHDTASLGQQTLRLSSGLSNNTQNTDLS
jgi:hypothetical protein